MRPGEISPIIPSLYGFHIFKILEKAPPRILEFAEVEVRIRDILQGRRREEFVRKQIESLRAKVVVEINERVLERVEI
jgi:parvulin-like peptidyl-prolyl isomerase